MNLLIELFTNALESKEEDSRSLYNSQLISATELAFKEEKGDFVTDIIRHFEKEGYEYNTLMDINFFFESVAAHAIGNDRHWLLVTLPFLASSSYGLPHGQLPESITSLITKHFKKFLPEGFQMSVNQDILNTEHFALSPVQLNRQIKHWGQIAKPGVCTFCASEEEAEEVNNLVADIRVIALIIEAPIGRSLAEIRLDAKTVGRLKALLAKELYRELKAHYLATKIELVMSHTPEMQKYLDNVLMFDDVVPEVLIAPPVITLTEAGRLFRHFSFTEALKNLQQTFNLKLEDLTFTIGNFYESPIMGCVALTEHRIGIGLKNKDDQILQGISWPLFMDQPDTAISTLINVLRVIGVQPENVTLLDETNFMVEDEDEEMAFPARDGELHEPQPPDDHTMPISFTLN